MRKAISTIAVAILCSAAISGSELYPVPSPLPSGAPGTIIWSQPFTGGSALKNAGLNTLVLYHSATAAGRDVAVSGVISIPKGSPPPGGWPVISWAHGTTGNAPQCASSRFSSQNGEQRFLDQWVAQGFVVTQTDYEGEGTPGLHPYFAGLAGAHDVIDIVRAARHLDPNVSNRLFIMGHSEGGSIALFAASMANSWAPEIHSLGAVAYAPAADIPDFFGETSVSQQPSSAVPLLLMMIEGIASTDPRVDLKTVLSPKGLALLPLLQSECITPIQNLPMWNSIVPASLFTSSARSGPLLQDFIANEPSMLHLQLPMLIEQGTIDSVVTYESSNSLRSILCGNGSRLQLDAVQGGTHESVLRLSSARVQQWVSDRLAGKAAPQNCPP